MFLVLITLQYFVQFFLSVFYSVLISLDFACILYQCTNTAVLLIFSGQTVCFHFHHNALTEYSIDLQYFDS